MTSELKKQISEHLRDAMNKEDLGNRDAARILNIAPYYVSMALNPKIYDSMSKASWERIQLWHETRDKLADFRYPEGEPVWQQPEKKERSLPDIINETDKKLKEKMGREPKLSEICHQVGKIKTGKATAASAFIMKDPISDDPIPLTVNLKLNISVALSGYEIIITK